MAEKTMSRKEAHNMPGFILRTCASVLAALLVSLAFAAQAEADFGIVDFDGSVLDSSGDPYTEAGGHPDEMAAGFLLNSTPGGPGVPDTPDGQMKDVAVDIPAGVVGDTTAVPECTVAELSSAPAGLGCPPDSQVGTLELAYSFGFSETVPLHNIEPGPGRAAQFGTNAIVLIMISASVRPDDYGITMRSRVPQVLPVIGVTPTIWGVPADHSPQEDRQPLLSLPTSCVGPVETTLEINSWQDPGDFHTASFLSHDNATPPNPIGATGCDRVPFDPSVDVEPRSDEAASPTGLDVGISFPTEGIKNPDGISQSHMKDVEISFPEGMSVNPSSVDGLGSCSPGQIGLGTDSEVNCPESSKIGEVGIETPILDESLTGSMYVAKQGDNPFDSLIALYLTAENEERGITIKLAGEVSLDPDTGQVVTRFEDNPQQPIKSLDVRLKGGSRAPLTTPAECGTYDIVTELTPWARPNEVVTRTSSFEVTEGCDTGGFDPGFSAGTVNPAGGAHSPFIARFTRDDGQEQMKRLDVALPEGLTGKLAGIPYCSEDALSSFGSDGITEAGTAQSEIDNPTCSSASQVGRVIIGAGAGSTPFYLQTGKAYLAGPYKGAPLSLAIVTPVKAGPFDLGSVLVRSALYVNDRTAQITVRSDELPTILEGIPLKIRDLRVIMDREEFTLNPTNCQETKVWALVQGTGNTHANLDNRFQAADCAALGFSPRFGMRILNPGRRSTLRSFNPAMRFTVAPPAGQANIDRAAVTLPSSVILDQSNIRTVCTRAQFAASECPEASIYGWARAWSPLLDEPVMGPVYLGSSDNQLPDLIADMKGQVDIVLQGEIQGTRDGRMRNIFNVVPDVPVSRFQLQMRGGAKTGILVNSTDLCRSSERGIANFRGQNGKRHVTRPRIGLRFKGCKQARQNTARRIIAKRKAARKLAFRQSARRAQRS